MPGLHITDCSAKVEAGLTSSDLVQSCCWSRAMCFTEPPTTALMTRQPVSERLGRTRKVPYRETASSQEHLFDGGKTKRWAACELGCTQEMLCRDTASYQAPDTTWPNCKALTDLFP